MARRLNAATHAADRPSVAQPADRMQPAAHAIHAKFPKAWIKLAGRLMSAMTASIGHNRVSSGQSWLSLYVSSNNANSSYV